MPSTSSLRCWSAAGNFASYSLLVDAFAETGYWIGDELTGPASISKIISQDPASMLRIYRAILHTSAITLASEAVAKGLRLDFD